MAILARSVTKHFGEFTALDDVSIEVPSGSLTALLGPSGSGKSTLLRVIAGLEQPESGTVELDGVDVSGQAAQKRGVGFVFQHYAAFKHMTVRENVAFGLKVRKRPRAEVKKRVDELLDLVQIAGWADNYPAQLSGGQRQRMALARALAVEPKVLLLDEPFGALDARVRKDLRAWLRRLHDEMHVTTIFVTHDQEEAMDIADQIVLMNRGRIEQVGEPRELYEDPANEFVMTFVGPVNRLGESFVRPHDLELRNDPNGHTTPGRVERIVHLGFEVRVELRLEDGRDVWAQVTRDEAEELELAPGGRGLRQAAPGEGLQLASARNGSSVDSSIGPTAGSQSRRQVVAARRAPLAPHEPVVEDLLLRDPHEGGPDRRASPTGSRTRRAAPSARAHGRASHPSRVFNVTNRRAGMPKTASGARPSIATPRVRRPSHHCARSVSTSRAGVSE